MGHNSKTGRKQTYLPHCTVGQISSFLPFVCSKNIPKLMISCRFRDSRAWFLAWFHLVPEDCGFTKVLISCRFRHSRAWFLTWFHLVPEDGDVTKVLISPGFRNSRAWFLAWFHLVSRGSEL